MINNLNACDMNSSKSQGYFAKQKQTQHFRHQCKLHTHAPAVQTCVDDVPMLLCETKRKRSTMHHAISPIRSDTRKERMLQRRLCINTLRWVQL